MLSSSEDDESPPAFSSLLSSLLDCSVDDDSHIESDRLLERRACCPIMGERCALNEGSVTYLLVTAIGSLTGSLIHFSTAIATPQTTANSTPTRMSASESVILTWTSICFCPENILRLIAPLHIFCTRFMHTCSFKPMSSSSSSSSPGKPSGSSTDLSSSLTISCVGDECAELAEKVLLNGLSNTFTYRMPRRQERL